MRKISLKGRQICQTSNEKQSGNAHLEIPMHTDSELLNIDLNSKRQAQTLLKRMYFLYSSKDFNMQHAHRSLRSIETNNAHVPPEQLLRHICFEYPNKQNKHYFALYLPTFLRLEILRINDLVVSHHKGSINALVHYDIDVTNLPDVLIDYLKQNCIWRLIFENDRTWKINKSSSKLQRQKIQKVDDRILLRSRFFSIFQTRVLTDIQWAPNQTANMLLSIKAQKLTIQKNQSQQYKKLISQIKRCSQQSMKDFQEDGIVIRFNMMDYGYELERQPGKSNLTNQEGYYKELPLVKDMTQVMYGPYLEYGPHKLCQREIKFEYSYKQENPFQEAEAKKLRQELNQSWWLKFLQSKTPRIRQSKPQRETEPNYSNQIPQGKQFVKKNLCHSICNAHFMLPLSRKPLPPFIKLFLPPYLFALLALVLFWQPLGMSGIGLRMSAHIFLFVALYTRLTIFNAQIHNLPKLSYIQKIQYLLTMIPVLAGFQTFIGTVNGNYQFQWYTDPLFLTALLLLAICTTFAIVFLVRYYFFRINQQSIEHGRKIDLKINEWILPACYREFAEVKTKRVYEAYAMQSQD